MANAAVHILCISLCYCGCWFLRTAIAACRTHHTPSTIFCFTSPKDVRFCLFRIAFIQNTLQLRIFYYTMYYRDYSQLPLCSQFLSFVRGRERKMMIFDLFGEKHDGEIRELGFRRNVNTECCDGKV